MTARLWHRPDPRWLDDGSVAGTSRLAKQPEDQSRGTTGRQRGGDTPLLPQGDGTTLTPEICGVSDIQRLLLILNAHLYYTI